MKKAAKRPSKTTRKAVKEKVARTSAPRNPGAALDAHFPVVGIGASAGGLEAFTQVLKNLAADTGMAYVLVQHLAPKQDSFLKELLARATKMPVAVAESGMAAEPNHLYVIAPNTDLEISGGRFRVCPRAAVRIPHYPVDQFLRSLAVDRGRRAIGVILSGTASDGTLGLKAIKSEGGITFAQSEASAKYPGMPASAMAAGVVDYVLPPDKIARELTRIGRHPYLRVHEAAPLPTEHEGLLPRLFSLLRNATDVDFTRYKHTTLRRRIGRRMLVRKFDKLADYLAFVKDHPEELQALYQDILINVTSFFRDRAMYRALNKSAFPRLLRNRTQEGPVRIWVPGCSTGEEAYSLAIALSDYMRHHGTSFPIQIFATDISEPAIERARAGVYPETITGDVPADLLRRYFVKVTNGYKVTHALREMCVFARQNMARDAPFSKMDLISCRNVLIYMEPILQRRVLSVFHYALKASGFLVLGTSETVGPLVDHFTLVDKKNKFYSKKGASTRLNLDFQTSGFPTEPAHPAPRPRERWAQDDAEREADRVLLDRYTPAGVVIDEAMRVLQFRGRTGRFLEPEPGEASLNLFRMAREGLLPDLRTAIHRARKKGGPARIDNVEVGEDAAAITVSIEAVPLEKGAPKGQYMLVLFEERAARQETTGRAAASKPESRDIRRLKQQLSANNQYLQSIIDDQEANNEELKSANEEIQSSNEELQSSNEELETAKEELQSTNEELTTVNEELQNRNLELAQVNDDLNNLLSSVQIPLVMVDSDLRLRRFTPSGEKLLNLIPSDVGRPLLDIKPNIDLPDLGDLLRDVIEHLHTVQREVRDRAGRDYSMWARPYRTAEKKIDGAVLFFVDITALKHSTEQTRDLREYAEAIAATVHETVVVLDGNLNLVTANARFYKAFDLTPSAAESQPFLEIAGGEWDVPALREALNEVARGHALTQRVEVTSQFSGVGVKALSINLRRMPAAGAARLIFMAVDDVSAQRLAETALLESEARFSRFTREAPVGILQMDAEGAATFINSRACAIVGVADGDALGFGWLTNLAAGDVTRLRARIAEARLQKQGFTFETWLVRPQRKDERVLLVSIPLFNERSGLTGYLSAVTDVTARKDLENQLRHSQKMEVVGRLAGGVAHEFNNMLTAIGTYAAQLLGSVPKRGSAHRLATEIGKVVERATITTRQLLAFTRKQTPRPPHVRLNPALQEMRDLLVRLLGDSIEVVFALASDVGTVMADPAQLQQMLLNLVVNSRDAMPDGGSLRISTECVSLDEAAAEALGVAPGDYARLSVSDTGAGIDPETREHLFEPFFTTKAPGAGTGLGLSMVHGVVQQSGGSITVESEIGKGATFHILLRRVAEVAELDPPPAPEDAPGTETILLVEDSEVVRSLVRELLEQRGYTVLEARDAREAIAIAGKRPGLIDLLLTDLMMPRMGGHELAQRLRGRRKDLKVIYMSGYSGEAVQAVEKDSNFLEKPFKPETLAAFVRKVLDQKKPS